MQLKTFVLVLGSLGCMASADRDLPVLYRVDQPTSNVVVFRGADVAKARAAGLLKGSGLSGGSSSSGSSSSSGNNGSGYRPAPPAPVTYAPPTTTYAPPPTTTAYVPPTTTAAPVTYPPPPPKVVYRPAPRPTYRPAPAPVTYRPAPVISYRPAPKPAPVAYRPAPSYQQPTYADVEAKYNWEYIVKDDYSGNDFGAKESRDGYLTQGKYYVALPDGRLQTVTYTADQNGYVPDVQYSGEAQYPPAAKPTYN